MHSLTTQAKSQSHDRGQSTKEVLQCTTDKYITRTDAVSSCCCLQPSSANLVTGNQERLFYYITWTDNQKYEDLFAIFNSIGEELLRSIALKCSVHKMQDQTEGQDEVRQEPNIKATNLVYATVEQTNRVYSDQTGCFLVTSLPGNKYNFVLYTYNANAILTDPLKVQIGKEIARAYEKSFLYLQARSFRPEMHWLNSEASELLKRFNNKRDVEYQLALPGCHRCNATERAF